MKKCFFFIPIVILLLSPIIYWFISSSTSLNIVIIDKTVPVKDYREHNGLTWLLNHKKVIKTDTGASYDASQDYYGFFPLPNNSYEILELPSDLEDVDLIYIADTYGVFEEEFYGENRGERSEKIYGGITTEEISVIHHYLKTQNATLVAEFNSFASPTSPEARNALTSLLSLDWDGWIGRYMVELNSKLSEEVPQWAIDQYEAQYNQAWNFSGAGYLLLHEDERIIVLEEDIHVGKGGISLAFTEQGQALFNLKRSPRYYYWFDIVTPHHEDDILANYQWDLTAAGKELLDRFEVPTSFAAILQSRNQGFTSYYFAGDYVDVGEVPSFHQMKGYAALRKWLSLDRKGDTKAFYWKTYVPIMSKILSLEQDKVEPSKKEVSIYEDEHGFYMSKLNANSFEVYQDGQWKEILIKGVNMGMAKPGTWPGEAAITENEYYRWFQMIGEMNANAIRVYTLHPPHFYRALQRYNQGAANPLYLFHGVWIDEEPLEETLDAFYPMEEFKKEITHVIDAIHGNIQVPERPGHASGNYTADVSPYVIGWILGIEWYPFMVLNTNEVYANLGDFDGKHVFTKGAEPFENWIANIFDFTIGYELEHYHWQRPISFTNWVTTDLLEHPSEPTPDEEDLVGIDPNVIYLKDHIQTGQFASYHAYPYYPDFLNFDPDYLAFVDHRGERNSYAAYLQDLHAAHQMPVLIAEFGVPSSRGLTHENPFGQNQGFLNEQEQGDINAHLFEDIVQERMLGGLIFAWQDEWFKRTWNTMDLDSPYRRPYWSDAQTNEQNFGLLSFDTLKIPMRGSKDDWTGEPLFENDKAVFFVDHDERYLYLRLDIDPSLNARVLIDTIEGQGNTEVSGVTTAGAGIDFVVEFNGLESTRIVVDSYYDIFYYMYGEGLNMIPRLDYPSQKNNGIFHPIEYVISKKMTIPTTGEIIPFTSYETGLLRHGTADPASDQFDSLSDFYISDGMVEFRIPWLLLNIKDPSLKEVFGDIWSKGIEASEFIDGIRFAVVVSEPDGKIVNSFPVLRNNSLNATEMANYTWDNWEVRPYRERLKTSYYIMQQLFEQY
ncbi:hypothetical protein DS745_05535 [Anaerobacillus alkaliphilus]|uniref:Family 2 glycosyl transferase n=1 Tax=Anaerobacillus alkaliphilus TaxID=1548597 RepID=A0A4Q0VVW4_9BACI|nr:hypothetical protein [Anaerobacillus alkaliphilus]RXJ02772.1 hypothetical protein DS745_05535 [Anaerobacillus alkaliphilus]